MGAVGGEGVGLEEEGGSWKGGDGEGGVQGSGEGQPVLIFPPDGDLLREGVGVVGMAGCEGEEGPCLRGDIAPQGLVGRAEVARWAGGCGLICLV